VLGQQRQSKTGSNRFYPQLFSPIFHNYPSIRLWKNCALYKVSPQPVLEQYHATVQLHLLPPHLLFDIHTETVI
jgi:hypothetical protein